MIKKAKIHIGAHKTASTHFQDTLNLMSDDLLLFSKKYFYRNKMRKTVEMASSNKQLSKFFFPFSKRNYIKKTLSLNSIVQDELLISEENILGDILDGLSLFPYKYCNPQFLRRFSEICDVEIHITLRSFDKVWPGAFSTGLRFAPENAIKKRNEILNVLNETNLPSWLPVIEKLRNTCPRAKIFITNYEDYKQDSSAMIRRFVGIDDIKVPEITNPASTSTPSFFAVEKIESLLKDNNIRRSDAWLDSVTKIIVENQPKELSEKYEFLTDEQSLMLQQRFKKDLKVISSFYSESFIKL